MAYQVFARKYRPQTFDQVVGQEHITQTLQNAIRMDRLAQAYLFVGPRGTGKTSTARILAKALNAPDGPRVDFDPAAEICREIAEGNCLDVLEIDGASNNGVEQVRDLRDNVRYAPAKGRYKIYIIDEVHMLSTAAFNALLKTLEEPPAHVKFLFATTEVHKLPATILSRCQRFDLRRIPEAKIAAHLAWICGREEVEAEAAALEAIARYAEGGLRDAESALDQVISFFGEKVTEADVLTMFGLTGLGPVAALSKAVAGGDTVAAMRLSRELITAGKDLGRLSQDLLRFFRNVTLYHISPDVISAELPPEEVEAVREVASLLRRPGALAILEELSQLESRLRYALAKDVLFEVALIQLSQLREKVSLEKILGAIAGGEPIPAPAEVIRQAEQEMPPASPSKAEKSTAHEAEGERPGGRPSAPLNKAEESTAHEPEGGGPGIRPSAPPSKAEVSTAHEPEGGGPGIRPSAPPSKAEVSTAYEPEGGGPGTRPSAPPLKDKEVLTSKPEGGEPSSRPPASPPEPVSTSFAEEEESPFNRDIRDAEAPAVAASPAKPPAPEPEKKAEKKPAVSARQPAPVAQPAEKWEAARAKFRAQREEEAELIDALYFISCRVNAFSIGVPTSFEGRIPVLRSPKYAGLLKELLREAVGGPVELAIVERDDPNAQPAAPAPSGAADTSAKYAQAAESAAGKPERMTQEEYENDPLIKEALELFDAKIAPAK
ncbi:MAG: DNA polymerase III subunit gamma/tau [Verrucomicrobiota bacterium]